MYPNTHRKKPSIETYPTTILVELAKKKPRETMKYSAGKVWSIIHHVYTHLARSLDVVYSDIVNLLLYYGSLDRRTVFMFAEDYRIPRLYYHERLYRWLRESTLRLEPIDMGEKYRWLHMILAKIGRIRKKDKHYYLLFLHRYQPFHTWTRDTRIWRGLYNIYRAFAQTANTYTYDAISDMILCASRNRELLGYILRRYVKIRNQAEIARVSEWIIRSLIYGRLDNPALIKDIVSGNGYKHTEIVMKILRTSRKSRRRSQR